MSSVIQASKRTIVLTVLLFCGGVQFVPAQDDSPQALYQSGMSRFASGNYAEALPYLQELIRVFGREPELQSQIDLVMYAQACALYNLGEYKEAVTAFDAYKTQFPESKFADEAYFRIAAAWQQLEEYDQALQAYQALRRAFPRSPYNEDAMFQVGLCYLILERPVDAAPVFRDFLTVFPDSALWGQAAAFAARALFDAGKPMEALDILQMLEEKPRSWSIVTYCNLLAFEMGDHLYDETEYELALKAYRRVKAKEALLRHQETHLKVLENELQQVQRAGRAGRSGSNMSSQFRHERRLSGDIAQAREMVEKLKNLPNYDAMLYHRIGRCFFNTDRYWEARVAFIRAKVVADDEKIREAAHFDLILSISRLRRFDDLQEEADLYLETYDPEGGW